MIEESISALMKGPAYPTINTWDIRICGEKNAKCLARGLEVSGVMGRREHSAGRVTVSKWSNQ